MHARQRTLRQIQRRQHLGKRRGHRTGGAGGLQSLSCLGARNIIRVAARQRKFRKLQGVGAIGGCLAGGNKLIGGRHLVAQDGCHLHEKIVGQSRDGRPLGNVGAVFQGRIRPGMSEAEVDAAIVYLAVKAALHRRRRHVVHVCCRGENAVISGCGGNGARVHENDAGKLTVRRL